MGRSPRIIALNHFLGIPREKLAVELCSNADLHPSPYRLSLLLYKGFAH
jgi:hypothetical protein